MIIGRVTKLEISRATKSMIIVVCVVCVLKYKTSK